MVTSSSREPIPPASRAAGHAAVTAAGLRCNHPGRPGRTTEDALPKTQRPGGGPLTGTETPRDVPSLPAGPPQVRPPTLRPRPVGAPKSTPVRRSGEDVVVDCAVYVDGRRQAAVT